MKQGNSKEIARNSLGLGLGLGRMGDEERTGLRLGVS
jgi:hypothetical protein